VAVKRALAASVLVLAACHDDWDKVYADCLDAGRCTTPTGGGGGGGSGTGGGSGGGAALKGIVLEWISPIDGGVFPTLEPDASYTLTFGLRNIGDTTSGAIDVSFSAAAAPFAADGLCGDTDNPLGPSARCNQRVVFTPTAIGTFTTQLIGSEELSGADASVTLTGIAAWKPIALNVFTDGGTGQGTVTVTTDDGGATICPAACAGLTYPRHTHLTLSAAGVGSDFTGWSGDCSSTGSCSVTLDADPGATVVAAFKAWPRLIVTVQPGTLAPGDVHISLADGGLDCTQPLCSAPVPPGSAYTVTAQGSAFATFAGWTGCPGGMGPICSGTIGMFDVPLTASFNGVNRAFVLWPGAALNKGDMGYDPLCGSQALNAGLGGVNWRALIATGSGAPQDHFAGVSGWVRVDGKPFTQDLLALTNTVYYPLTLDATGMDRSVSGPLVVATGMDGGNCGNWSQITGNVTAGVATQAAGKLWANSDTSHLCSEMLPIYCLQADYAASVQPPPIPDGGRLAFMSTGRIGPSSPPDQLCASEADGGFLALRSDDMVAASTRFDLDGGTWYRPDGVQLFATASALATPGPFALQAPISQTSYLVYQTAQRDVWTGSPWPAEPGDAGTTCGAWGTSGFNAIVGNAVESTQAWFDRGQLSCSSSAHVYCFQQ
jgi:hypothetical protein